MASEFTLGEVLGSGAFGKVYKATKVCALKAIDISTVRDSERSAKKKEWKQEVEALMKVRGHENIVEYRSSFASVDNKLWVEMEYCNGGTLNDYVIEKNPGRDIKHRFMVEMSSGVAFLHANGIVHRDLKPENIMITIDDDQQPHAKVGDFGLAKVLASCNYEGAVLQYYLTSGCGTEYFMAPEVYDHHYTEKADIFSMGMIFFCMIPTPSWKTIDNKRYLLTRFKPALKGRPGTDYVSFGRHMYETNINLGYKDTYTEQLGSNIVELIHSMIRKSPDKRPSAEKVATTLHSISPKELSLLAPAPVSTP